VRRPENFQGWVDLRVARLTEVAARRGRQLPAWNRLRVTEDADGQRTGRWATIDEFEPVFQSVLRRTTRCWVNLETDPIEDGVLTLVLRYISRHDRFAVRTDPDRISVNFSGPSIAWWDSLPLTTQPH
jgi:hypothetical protein